MYSNKENALKALFDHGYSDDDIKRIKNEGYPNLETYLDSQSLLIELMDLWQQRRCPAASFHAIETLTSYIYHGLSHGAETDEEKKNEALKTLRAVMRKVAHGVGAYNVELRFGDEAKNEESSDVEKAEPTKKVIH